MEEEIFGPILTIYSTTTINIIETLNLCDETSPYALTGAVFATDRDAINKAESILRYAAGNFYINDKTTAASIGLQPSAARELGNERQGRQQTQPDPLVLAENGQRKPPAPA